MTAPAFRIAPDALAAWVAGVLEALGTRRDQAESVARVLVDADLCGVESHGVARLPAYVRLIDRGLLDLTAEPVVERRDGATALVDARNAFGPPAAELGVDEACALAAAHGVGWCVVRRSNHFGTAGYYTRRAADRGLVALAGTNSASVVVPTRARERHIGTNPVAFAAPSADGTPISLDMSTSAVAGGKLEWAMRENRPIPLGWGLTPDGQETMDPADVMAKGGGLVPLGGSEQHSSYKGYGLAVMVEVLTALLADGPYTRGVGALTTAEPDRPAGISHFFVALDPGRFASSGPFPQRVADLSAELRGLAPVDPERPVLVPGDPERTAARERGARGIPLEAAVEASLRVLAARTDVELDGGTHVRDATPGTGPEGR